ncbi:unnamed protein product [Hapterophycus canaliculatus]
MFHSFSLRGNLILTTAELEMALSLVDGLEVRSVVQFLDKDNSGTIDVAEVDEAIRDFRELSRDLPSLGTGPLTVLDAAEIDRLARRTFADIAARRTSSPLMGNNEKGDDGDRDGDEVDRNKEGGRNTTISVADISEAFREAFQQFKADGEGKHSIGAMRHPGTQQPSTDTQHAQVRVDKMMAWLRSSRTFDRAPTGRVPTLAEQMTERQKMELELQNKLQEKRRRAAGQRHWEEWVSRKAGICKPGSVNDNDHAGGGGDDESGVSGASARRRRHDEQREREAQEEQRRKKDQDEAFAAWAREKDRILRARKREERRAITAGGLNTLETINKKLRGGRSATPNRYVKYVLPRLGCRSSGGSPTSGVQALDGGDDGGDGSVTTGGNKGAHGSVSRSRAPVMKKAELKALDLAVTRVAVSPYRVRAKDKYQHSKHIEGGEIVTRMARDRSKPFPKALVEEGWQVTSLLLGSASMSLIDHPTARHAAAVARRGCSSESGSNWEDRHHLAAETLVDNKSTPPHRKNSASRSNNGGRKGGRRRRRRIAPTACAERRGSARRQEQERRPLDQQGIPSSAADAPLGAVAAAVVAAPEKVSRASAPAPRCSGGGSGANNDGSVVSFVVAGSSFSGAGVDASSASERPSSGAKGHDNKSSVQNTESARTNPPTATEEGGGCKRNTEGGDGGENDALHGDAAVAAAAAAVGARPDGRRGNSRGAPEGTGHGDGLDGTATVGGVGGEGSRRGSSNSEDMEFPIQSQALPDWADTIKDLPVDDPYEEGEDDFEPDDELTSSPAK